MRSNSHHNHVPKSKEKSWRFIWREQSSNLAFKGMVDNPQDREAAANKLFFALNVIMHNFYFSVSSAEIVAIMEGSAENIAAVEMVTSSTGTLSAFEAIEIIDFKLMTSTMVTANKVVSVYQAPNQ